MTSTDIQKECDVRIGTPTQAILWALEECEPGEVRTFLKDWSEGAVSEWPDYVTWLRAR